MERARLHHRRNFSQRQSVNRRALGAKSFLELRERQLEIASIDKIESCGNLGQAFDLLEIIEVIGRDMEEAVFFERGMN